MQTKRFMALLTIAISAALTLSGCDNSTSTQAKSEHPQEKQQSNTTVAEKKAPVVAIEPVTKIPDFASIKDIPTKKKAFFDFMRPIVEAENAKVVARRAELLKIRERITRGETLDDQSREFVMQAAEDYRIEMVDLTDPEPWKTLLRRVGKVPVRLVLAQSANESSWGTSRFARKGFNFFGQWCFSKGCGIVPSQRSAGMVHEVAVFDSVNASVASYLRNLNTGRVYKPLREIRAEARRNNEAITARALAAGLLKYSERGEEYVKEIRAMIRVNYDLMVAEKKA